MLFPSINRTATGINLRRIMDSKNITVRDLKDYLGLGSIQSVYHWLNGICLPTVDNLYAMSIYFDLPIDELLCGSHKRVMHTTALFWEHFSPEPQADYIEIFRYTRPEQIS